MPIMSDPYFFIVAQDGATLYVNVGLITLFEVENNGEGRIHLLGGRVITLKSKYDIETLQKLLFSVSDLHNHGEEFEDEDEDSTEGNNGN